VVPIASEPALSLLLSPSNLQIDNPRRIAPGKLRPFREGARQVLLLPAGDTRALAADLGTLRRTYLIAYAQDAGRLRLYTGDVLLVVFPVGPRERYVLQTFIEDVHRDAVRLRYQDPRYDRRWTASGAAALHVASPELSTLVDRQRVQLTREIVGLTEGLCAQGTGSIVDRVETAPPDDAGLDRSVFEALPPVRGEARDFSLGGAGVALLERPPRERVMNRIIQLRFNLPRLVPEARGPDWMPVRLCLLGAVRTVSDTADGCTAHIRFLRRLPAELDIRFEAWDRRLRAGAGAG
jgi:hypothetical protein